MRTPANYPVGSSLRCFASSLAGSLSISLCVLLSFWIASLASCLVSSLVLRLTSCLVISLASTGASSILACFLGSLVISVWALLPVVFRSLLWAMFSSVEIPSVETEGRFYVSIEEGMYVCLCFILWCMLWFINTLCVADIRYPPQHFLAEREGQDHSHPGIACPSGTAAWRFAP